MARFMACLVTILALAVARPTAAQSATAQSQTLDPDVVKGIQMVDDGDYDGAILTLDNATRRLAADKAKVHDLSQAYLYLGIAYIGKGREAAARAQFREALERVKDLTLSPEKFPPKVIDALEAAREELARNPPPAAGSAQASPKKKGGSGKTLLILGGVAAAGGGAALALGGGGSSSSATTQPTESRHSMSFTGTLPNASSSYQCYQIVATQAGTLEADLRWTNPQIELGIDCQEHDPPYTQCTGGSNRTSNTTAVLMTPVTQKAYDVCVSNNNEVQDNFTLTVLFP